MVWIQIKVYQQTTKVADSKEKVNIYIDWSWSNREKNDQTCAQIQEVVRGGPTLMVFFWFFS